MLQATKSSMLADWLETPKGSYVLAWERGQFDAAVEDVFGFNAVQLGLPGVDFLRESRIPLKVRAGLEPGCGLLSEPVQLPLASQSTDLLALPHVLEFSGRPHAILREERRQVPWCGRFIGLLRLKDWLALLGFELNGGRFGCYAPPFSQGRWLERFGFMEKAGDRWWPICGGVYVVRAVKRVAGMRLVTPNWRDKRAPKKALAPVTQRENGLHVEKRERRQA